MFELITRVDETTTMLVKAVRKGLGLMIVGVDKLTRPKGIKRTTRQQSQAQDAIKNLALYQLYACPFCVKTRRAIHQLNVDIELRDIGKNPEHRQTLQEQGGKTMVPCLRIKEGDEVSWLYESDDIIAFLKQRLEGM
ncbi:MAG: glutaredoxin family protein [Cellvibrionaceae bacterium]